MPTLTKNTPSKLFGKQFVDIAISKLFLRICAVKGKVALITKCDEIRNRVVCSIAIYMMNVKHCKFVATALTDIFVTFKGYFSVFIKNLWVLPPTTYTTNELSSVWSRKLYKTFCTTNNIAILPYVLHMTNLQQYNQLIAKSK